ncbi:MAG: hypothetical protein CMJ83_12910, partial [Planctomycetes bacterium]|nr:hypothetical protein [Planctomycetota bacterium]
MRDRFLLGLLLLASFAASYRALDMGYLSDDWLIMNWVSRHDVTVDGSWLGLEKIRFHRPLQVWLYELEYDLFGVDPFAAHLHHMGWCLLTVALLFILIRKLGGSSWAALFGGLMFALHPHLAPNAGWLAARAGVVPGALTLLALVAWLRADETASSRSSGAWRGLSVVAAAVAALGRESGYLALFAPLILDVLWRQPRPAILSLVKRHAAFVVAGIGLLSLRYRALGTLGGGYPDPDGLLRGSGFIMTTLSDLWDALGTLVGPYPQLFMEERWPAWGIGGFTLVAILAGLYCGRGSRTSARARVVAALFSCQLALLVVSGPTLAPAIGHRWHCAIAMWCALVAIAVDPLLVRRFGFVPMVLVPALLYPHAIVMNEHVDADRLTQNTIRRIAEEIE